MEYKIAEIKVNSTEQYFYVIVGRNNSHENWHVLCGNDKLVKNAESGTGLKLKKLSDDGFITMFGDLVANQECVNFSKTYTREELIKLIYVSRTNCICFYGCSTGKLIAEPGTRNTRVLENEFFYTPDSKENLSVLRIKSSKEDGPFEIKKENFPYLNGNVFTNTNNRFDVDSTNFVATDLTEMYPIIHYRSMFSSIKPSWFVPELSDDLKKSVAKSEDVTIEKIIGEFQAKFADAKIHNIRGSGSCADVDPLVFQFPKCSRLEQEKIENELFEFLKQFGKIRKGLSNQSAILSDKLLFWVAFDTLDTAFSSNQNKLKFAVSIDGRGRRWIESVFAGNETIQKFLGEKNLNFWQFLETDFAKENKDLHISGLIPKLKFFLRKNSNKKMLFRNLKRFQKKK